jgi:pimeloyl-ACP methyl ester carboxylesterase
MKKLIASLVSAIILSILAFFGIRQMNSLSPRQTEKSESGSKVAIEELSYLNGDTKVFGKLYRPAEAALKGTEMSRRKFPTVVFCHGLGMNCDYWHSWCRALAGEGIIAYAFDFQGGAMQNCRSTSDMMHMTPETEREDLAMVMQRLRKEKFVDKDSIYLVGHSLGGLVASQYASGDGKRLLKGLVLMAPAFNIHDDALALYPKAKEIKDTTILMGCTLGRDYFVSARKYDPYKWLHRFDKPVLILGAGSDDKVPAEYLEKAAEAFPDANLKMIDHGDHLFTAMARKEALNAVEGFLSRK